MIMPFRQSAKARALCALATLALPLPALAQGIGYGPVEDTGGEVSAPDAGGESAAAKPKVRGSRGGKARQTRIAPYIEASQIVSAELSPGDEVLTWSTIAAGVDAQVQGSNNAASLSVRYERRFGWSRNAEDGDMLSGVARGYTSVAPGVRLEAGALATRSGVEAEGGAVTGAPRGRDGVSNVYSVYAGPSVSTRAGDVGISASYRLGYTRLDEEGTVPSVAGVPEIDVFEDSVVHVASVQAGVKPYEVLPVGLGAGANYYREDISNLDQRVEDLRARADITVPVADTVALVGGVGYEKVRISGRDAVRDATGDAVVGADGRYVVDKAGPRRIAYDVDGLIWDAGVVWRPSRRTALEAHVGRRYGSTSYFGSFAYAPSPRSSFNVSVYDSVSGFGGQVNRALADLPTGFTAVRNPLTGDIGGCVAAVEKGGCLSGALGSVRSATFRGRGVMATYGRVIGRYQAGIGFGYDRRKFIAAPGTVLAAANGVVDENYWMNAYVNGRLSQHDGFTTSVYANWLQTGAGFAGDASAVGANASYYRNLTSKLSATAALGIDGVNRDDPLEDFWTASALLGVRYNF